jgi:hypothetical protein
LLVSALVASVLAACGGSDSDDGADTTVGGDTANTVPSGGGTVVNPQPHGQAFASVDGQEFTFTEPGALDCNVEPDTLTFSFKIGDNEVTFGGGANLYDTGWLGSFDLNVANPENGPGPARYSPSLADNGDLIVIEGASMSYAGPMQLQPPNDGSNPPPVDAGDGIFSLTCP